MTRFLLRESEQWRVVYCSRQEDGPPQRAIALTGSTRAAVFWMFEALCDHDTCPEVIWVQLQRAEWQIVARYLEPRA